MPAARVCPRPGCPELTTGGPCATHRREVEQARGSRHERGYDAKHEAQRRLALAQLAAGQVMHCPRCGARLWPSEASRLHLDHTDDRTGYLGLSHDTCNLSAGGRAAHA